MVRRPSTMKLYEYSSPSSGWLVNDQTPPGPSRSAAEPGASYVSVFQASFVFNCANETRVYSLLTITLAFCKPMNAINRPIPTEIAFLIETGIPSNIFSHSVIHLPVSLSLEIGTKDTIKKIIPEINTNSIALPNENA